MPVFQKLINFNELFHSLSEPPIVINDLSNNSEEDKEKIKELITTRYTGDMIALLPSCRCGVTKGEFSVGVKCEYCNSIVKSTVETNIEPTIWFRKPVGVSKLISPIIWLMLKTRFTKTGFNVIHWLTDTSYRTTTKQPVVVNKIIESGMQRGYNNFVENFDTIMEYLFSLKAFSLKTGKIDYLRSLIENNRDHIFSDYIPLPNKSLLIVEKTNVGIYVDPIILDAVDAIEMLVSIDRNFHDQSLRVKENRTAKAIYKLAEFYENYYKTNLSPKPGQFRKHIFGTRTNFSFRAVISSITDEHNHDEIYVPWGIGISAFRPHLLNKLLKLGMDINSAIGLLLGHVEKYHPLLDTLLKELISESSSNGLFCILQRNPSLLQGSAQRVKITRFKTDPKDHTISISILIVKAPNADFDGDAVNVSIGLDNFMDAKWAGLAPKFNILQLGDIHGVTNNIAIPKPVIISMGNWLSAT